MNDIDKWEDRSEEDKIEPDLSDIKVHGWNLLVRPIKVRSETKEGLKMADKTKADIQYLNNVAKVIKMGPECYPSLEKAWVQVGDLIVYKKNAGQRVRVKGVVYLLLSADLPLLTVSSPEDVDPMLNIENW